MIGKFKNRVTITRYGAPTKDSGGGMVQGTPATPVPKWAMVENRSGSIQTGSDKEWSYDYKITLRYDPAFVERSNDVVTHESLKLLVRSVSFEDEGQKRLVVLRCSRHE